MGIVTSLTKSSQRAEERARKQEELVTSYLGTITQLHGALEVKQQEMDRSTQSLERSREASALELYKYVELCRQRRLDAHGLFRLAEPAQAGLSRLSLPVADLPDQNFENISRFYADLVGRLEALPSFLEGP